MAQVGVPLLLGLLGKGEGKAKRGKGNRIAGTGNRIAGKGPFGDFMKSAGKQVLQQTAAAAVPALTAALAGQANEGYKKFTGGKKKKGSKRVGAKKVPTYSQAKAIRPII
jgi:hypothetical protein